MNNFEKIKAMSINEMRDILVCNTTACRYCIYENDKNCSPPEKCIDGIKQWLESEVEWN